MTNNEPLPSKDIDHTISIAPQVYDYLRARIVDNRLSPGTKISEAPLASKLKISRTPLRVALQQLAKEGLVDTRPQVGNIVAELDNAQLQEAVLIRAALEAEVVNKLARAKADLSTLEPIMAVQERAAQLGDYATFFGQDEAFHAELARIAGMPRAWKLTHSIKGHVDRQRYTLMSSIQHRSQRAFEEHLRIVDEIQSGCPSGAVREMRVHVKSVLQLGLHDHGEDLPET
jgi:DNA-binding GntR family transcriptional regulator|tara:strand:+ start:1317 stop:2006 length:690 start_codon:yes stop_codon:yes gene_type:complete